ncbi:MAG: glycoside hydrolase family 28 protein, partial [Planctomycetota bacterium]
MRDAGAAGDGKTLDTRAIRSAIEACAASGGGQVLFPPGEYLSGTVRLASKVVLKLEAGARLVGTSELGEYEHFTPPPEAPEARNLKWHRALVLLDGVEDAAILGPGTIDGNKVFDPRGEEKMRGPHTIVVGASRRVRIEDLWIRDSANYAVLIEFSDEVEVRRAKITGGWDGVHFRGWKDRPCRDLKIVGCEFYTGDDSIAGRYAEDLLVRDCVVNSSSNGVRIIGPLRRFVFEDCLFYGPGLHPHRTSRRHNMLSGIILQPGAWDPCDGAVEDGLISQVTMRGVASPVTVWLKRPGNSVERVTVTRLSATGVYRAAASVESWTETPAGRIVFRDCDFEFAAAGGGGGPAGSAPAGPKAPGVDARELPAWGFYARNAAH